VHIRGVPLFIEDPRRSDRHGQTAMKMFKQFQQLRKKPYWGNHFWAKGYCVDTVGLDADMIRKYVRYQEEKEKQLEQLQLY
jgi:putative transposase